MIFGGINYLAIVIAAVAAWRIRTFLAFAPGWTIGERSLAAGTVIPVEARWTVFAVAGIRAPLAVAFGFKSPLGEFLLRPAGGAGAAFSARRAITPAAGIVVFVIVAGHE